MAAVSPRYRALLEAGSDDCYIPGKRATDQEFQKSSAARSLRSLIFYVQLVAQHVGKGRSAFGRPFTEGG
ncbi:MAG: hypothetical protein AUG50_01820 [Betaproteobacteria bacterium 13_1_20CM_3_63_8]|nr:MAG: hypothetical protein AUG50_01820 [Betaproteobacteria bacterium 13_1_20CM_3_63_8]